MSLLLLLIACTDSGPAFKGSGPNNWVLDTSSTQTDDTTDTVDTADTSETGETNDTSADDSGNGETIPGSDDCSYDAGDVACNLIADTQSGANFRLWDQYGRVTVVMMGHAYDFSLQQMATGLDAVVDGNRATGAVMLLNNINELPAGQSDAADFASLFNVSTVLHDSSGGLRSDWASTGTTRLYLFDQDMRIRRVAFGYVDPDDLEGWIQGL